MYVLSLSVYSDDGSFNLSCLSKSILITSITQTFPSCTVDTTPNVLLNYSGNYSAIEPERVKSLIYNMMLNLNATLGCISVYSGSIMIAATSDTVIPTSNLSDIGESGMTFSSATYNGVKIAVVNIASVNITANISLPSIFVNNVGSNTTNANSNINIIVPGSGVKVNFIINLII